MSSMLPAAVYTLRVPAGGMPIPGLSDFPASYRITMAAIDPSAEPQIDEDYKIPRATLKVVRVPVGSDDDDGEDEDDEDYDEHDVDSIRKTLQGIISDEDVDMSDEDEGDDSEGEKKGGPSDPAKAKKMKQEALSKKLKEELDSLADDSLTNGVNGKSKGKAKAVDGVDSDDDSEIESDDEVEEFVLCTLDPEKHYQQTMDITVGEHEEVYFSANGTYDIYLTGNFVLPPNDGGDDSNEEDYDSDEMDYDLSPDEDELDAEDDDEEDELDDLDDPRITEVDTDDEPTPRLVEIVSKKGKKRPAESDDDAVTLDELISKAVKPEAATNGEEKLSKKQAKKLKKNDGQAVAAAQEAAKKDDKEAPNSDKKKVQFAKNLELGPTGSPKVEEAKKEAPKPGPKVLNGVTVEDKKVGKGKAAKKGDRIEMRYIGKLKSGKQFDANKKGKPFSFKLGVGEVIKGWDFGVVGMTAGGERRLTIPANLAYGKKGAPPDIPPNSDLVFDIKCLSVN